VVNKVRETTEYGSKMLTLVKESRNSPEFKSLSLRHKKTTPYGVVFLWLMHLCGELFILH